MYLYKYIYISQTRMELKKGTMEGSLLKTKRGQQNESVEH